MIDPSTLPLQKSKSRIIFLAMKELFRNPHPVDMSNYYYGNVFVMGGRDFDREEKESPKENTLQNDKKKSYELDWSFLKSRQKLHSKK